LGHREEAVGRGNVPVSVPPLFFVLCRYNCQVKNLSTVTLRGPQLAENPTANLCEEACLLVEWLANSSDSIR
jgi:hypothetical protein